jgi:hypothetical protein
MSQARMKKILIAIGVVGVIAVALVVIVLFKAANVVREAHGRALYSSYGAYTRIQEFAHAKGDTNYIAEADKTVAMIEHDLKQWRETALASGKDISKFEKMQADAYAVTDQNIKSGQNPLAYLDSLSSSRTNGDAAQANAQKPAGMSEFDYLACDGGPHLVLPKELSKNWKGTGSILGAINPFSDYRKACDAVSSQQMALISVGAGQAMVLADPPLSAWGRSPEGWIDIYYLNAWADTNTDAMIKRAVAVTPTSAMTDTGKPMTLKESGLILLFAGDSPGNTAYGENAIPIAPGTYRILEGHYKAGTTEEIFIYRLQPKSP